MRLHPVKRKPASAKQRAIGTSYTYLLLIERRMNCGVQQTRRRFFFFFREMNCSNTRNFCRASRRDCGKSCRHCRKRIEPFGRTGCCTTRWPCSGAAPQGWRAVHTFAFSFRIESCRHCRQTRKPAGQTPAGQGTIPGRSYRGWSSCMRRREPIPYPDWITGSIK